jgi:glycosyltransferase involved in cell wall biosynthesis
MAGYLYKIIYGGRLIHTFHSEPEKRLFCIGKIFLQKMINMCDSVTFVSKGLKDSIIEFYGLRFQTSDITYSGVKEKVPSKEAMNSFYSQYGINANSIILLIQAFTSYNLKKKGVIYVLDAMKELIPKYPNMVLILTKEGLYSNELRDYSNSIGISKNIIFTGNVSNPFVPLEICDIFVFPWLGKSGIGIALIEAMIMGKPIIATSLNGYGVSEVLDDGINGFLVEPSAELIATKIEYLIQNPEFAKEMGCRAKVDADKKFTWGKTADLFYNIYNCG